MYKQFEQTLTFDDVLLVPQASSLLPKDAVLKTKLTNDILLNLPFLSSPMDTVTEHKMAIAMALAGGLGVIHKNMSIAAQADEVKKVKRFENGFIEDPITVGPNAPIADVVKIRETHGYKKVPVVDRGGKLLGLISDVDYFMPDHKKTLVKKRMVLKKHLIVGRAGMTLEQANKMIHDHRLRVLCIVDQHGRLTGMVTRRDIEKNIQYTEAVKNNLKQLRVGAAIGVGKSGMERAEALVGAGADAIIVDTAHGHSNGVIETVRDVKKRWKDAQVIGGNIATAEAARALVDAGADAVKVGIGPGSICTTRIVAGIGVPQLSAILEVARGVAKFKKKVPVIADGGIKSSGDIVKALAAGASCVMMGNMFAGTDETPGRVEFRSGQMFKVYRGMGSIDAMEEGSKDRYGQGDVSEKKKFVPEGVSGRVAYKGPVDRMLYQLAGGLRSGMGYVGAKTILELQKNAHFITISNSSLKESHPHDLSQIDSAPNYSVE